MNIGLTAGDFQRWKESENDANLLASSAIYLRLHAIFERVMGAALTHRTAMGGVSLVAGLALATGADTIPQALLTLSAFAVAAKCLHEEEEEGGAR